jgi:plastocyanin
LLVHALTALLTATVAAPPIPPAPPADIATLIAAAPADAAAATRMLTENGVPASRRAEAIALLAKEQGKPQATVLLDAIAACAGACGGTRDLADALVGMHAEIAADPALLARTVQMAGDAALEAPARMAAYRTVCAMPADKRPEAAKAFAIRTIALKTIPGAMQYDVKELKAKPGEALEVVMENPDSMQHNFLLVAPGKLAEAGIAGDKMGETAEGKARHFVPDAPWVLEVMGLIDPGKTGRLFFFAPTKPGTYPYVCTYPAHWRNMNGKLKVQAP